MTDKATENPDAAGGAPLQRSVRPHHTEGPWRVQQYSWQRGNVSVFAPKFGRAPYGACVAYTPCSDGVGGADGALANAHLIAAAPELLRELEHLVRLVEPCIQDGRASIPGLATFNGAKAAIAKARGLAA